MGIGVLGFVVDNLTQIHQRYQQLHPKLIAGYDEFDQQLKILQVYAYYDAQHKQADPGTILRFVQVLDDTAVFGSSLGFCSVPATFPPTSHPAYFDHWVSNVWSRTEFLQTLQDTLGFCPKVDFNAGVVAAGEAQIESTVTGNTLTKEITPAEALKDQSQVYLPINNALSAVGHVHGFLQELGQGVQHIASRVENIVDFVQQANDTRRMTGEGFSFLNIPRSYYGILQPGDLPKDCREAVWEALQVAGIMDLDGSVDLDATRESLGTILEQQLSEADLPAFEENKEEVLRTICQSRYQNLHSLLANHVSEATYLAIVRNQILVDIQGDDLLYQIFTCNILQRKAGDEAPFLEFIQRVCSECKDENGCPKKVRPGCGGFGT